MRLPFSRLQQSRRQVSHAFDRRGGKSVAKGKDLGPKNTGPRPAPTGNPGTKDETQGTTKIAPTGNKGTRTSGPVKTQ
jgi:hypothetical protein